METQTKQRYTETNRSYGPNEFIDICRTFHPKTKEYTFFSAPHGTFSKIGLNQYKKIEIIPASYQTTTN
jgi:exonuclease III